jgi:subtilisin family serine protease
MAKTDPGLRFLADQKKTTLRALADEVAFTFEAEAGQPATATVLLQFQGDLSAIEAAGFKTRSFAGDVATGEIELAQLGALERLDSVVRMEVSRVLGRELDLAIPESRVDTVHTGPPGHRGAGVVVGIIDSGIDFTHEAFRRSDGTSRILAIWDQRLVPQAGESNPSTFSYGVEYQKSAIDAALTAPNPSAVVRHQDLQIPGDGFHGTHVAGIAAGDGSVAGQGQPAFTFVGVAPEADIVVVANTRGRAAGERGLGDSADTLDAIRYIFDFAASLGRPVVINQSQGDNIGPHDGTSLLERGIDNLLGGPGRAMVKSAGNEGVQNRHASSTLTAGGPQSVPFAVPVNQGTPVTIDLWYGGPDRFDVSITPPNGVASATVNPGNSTTLALPNNNQAFVDSDLNDAGNGDNRIFVVLSPGTAPTVQAGTWSITIQGTTITLGQWDAWIQRDARAQFLPPFQNPARTISVPGTAQEIITAGSYVTRGAGVGSISSFSSLGPTRDGRQAPTVAAPGQVLMAPQPTATGDTYGLMQGTSMASPMVTGTVALLLQKSSSLTQAQIRDCLTGTARTDGFTGVTPNNAWGGGKLDANAAFGCAPGQVLTLAPPCPVTLQPPCPPNTTGPPCPPLTTAPPCPLTLGPPCPPPTFGPPCPPPTLRPPCLPPTLRPPCPPPTFRPPCLPPTVGPPCVPPTIRPPCPPPTFRPPCPPGPVGAAGGPAAGTGSDTPTSGGWAPVDAGGYDAGWYDPYGADWGLAVAAEWWPGPYEAWSAAYGTTTPGGLPASAEAQGAGGASAADAGSGVTAYWHGNPGY